MLKFEVSKQSRQYKIIFSKALCLVLAIFMITGYLMPFSSMTADAVSIDVYDKESLNIALNDGADITLWSDINVGSDALNVNQTSSIDLNGYSLTANASIIVASGQTLTIKDSQYTSDNPGTGKLVVTGSTNSAGIIATDATLIILSGVVNATGGDGVSNHIGGDGIQGGVVTIYGGSITAVGRMGGNGISGAGVTIYGGTIKATGGAALLGGNGICATASTGVTIWGGNIEAIGGKCPENLEQGDYGGNGIGIEYLKAIYGGTIKASSGNQLRLVGSIISDGQQYPMYGYGSDDVYGIGRSVIITNCTLELCLAGYGAFDCNIETAKKGFSNCTIFGEGAKNANKECWGTYDSSGQLITGTVTFDSMDGFAATTKTVAIGLTVAEPREQYRDYHTFDGWYNAETGGEKVEFPYTVTEDVTLYARWIPYTYVITYESKGGSDIQSQTLDYGTVIEEPIIPTKTGYNFNGWYDAETAGEEIEFPYTVTEDATFYARWSRKIYTVTFDTNGGPEKTSRNVYYKTMIIIPDPVWEGKQFLGWYTEKNGGTKIEFPYTVTDNVTLYARWSDTFMGDVNLDGVFDVADIKLLQDYLVCRETLTAEQGAVADVCTDGILDVFDLCILKRMYLEKSETA